MMKEELRMEKQIYAAQSHLSSGSRLRKDGREIAEARRADSAR
jgi:hypothetical protein